MTKKTILYFHTAHGTYVPGDVAGFDPTHADRFKLVAEPYDKVKHGQKKVDGPKEVEQHAAAMAELDQRERELAAREAKIVETDGVNAADSARATEALDKRERELAEREQALSEREAALNAPKDASEKSESDDPAKSDAASKTTGEPPKTKSAKS